MIMQVVDATAFTDRFFRMEEDLRLFADQAYGDGWWDTVRFDVYWRAYRQATGMAEPVGPPISLSKRLVGWGRRSIMRWQLAWRARTSRHDVLVIRAARQTRNGRSIDPALDDLVTLCPGRPLVVDTYPHYYHIRPLRKRPPVEAVHPVVVSLVARLQADLGVRDSAEALSVFIAERRFRWGHARANYRALLSTIEPKLVLAVQNGIEKALFVAAHDLGIPVVEAQHGLIGHAHAAYSYSPRIDYRGHQSFPDLFLTFSEYWRRSCHYPAATCAAVGNDQFMVPDVESAQEPGAVMIVSADIYHPVLLEWLPAMASALPERRFIYKLHPNQQTAAPGIRQELASWPNVEVVDGQTPAREMLVQVSHVVLIQSTVTHEALQAGRMVCIIPRLNYQVHRDLFDAPGVVLTPTPDALLQALQEARAPEATTRYFEPLDRQRASALLSELAERSSGARRLAATS